MNINYISVTQINLYLKRIFDENIHLRKIFIKGEISNFKKHFSGHLYFTLKDDSSRINAVMFKTNASKLKFIPEDGMKVLIEGRVSVYPEGGSYQIYVDKIEQDGLGNLFIEYEKLKKKLQEEGLFDKEHKKAIPKYPLTIGVVTAETGAAIHDITSTIKRRFPLTTVYLFPALVQGKDASKDIIKKLKQADDYNLELIIIGRGGGSIEDLWAFNDEELARVIYNAKTPIISAVGHEVDFTIADFVADMRAPTPTGAAEMSVPELSDVKVLFSSKKNELYSRITNKLELNKETLTKLSNSYFLKNPLMLYENKSLKLDDFNNRLNKSIDLILKTNTNKINTLKENYILQNPKVIYESKLNTIKTNITLLNKNMNLVINTNEHKLQYIIQTLKLVNPLNILDKGYSLVKKDNTIIKDIKNININDEINIKLSKGSIKATVKEKLDK